MRDGLGRGQASSQCPAPSTQLSQPTDRPSTPPHWRPQDHRARVKAGLPAGAKMGDVSKALGEEWKALSAEDKAQYEERARADKVHGRGRAGRGSGQAPPACMRTRRWAAAASRCRRLRARPDRPAGALYPPPCLPPLVRLTQARYEREMAAYKAGAAGGGDDEGGDEGEEAEPMEGDD